MSSEALIDGGGLVVMSLYFLSLIGIGLAGRFASREESLSDFYLSGRSMGLTVLFLTLYATQYSGNTLIGFAGRAYREGFLFLMSVTFMMAVIGVYLLYAPKLRRLAERFEFITIGDYVQHRYSNSGLTIVVTILAIVALGNYVLTNLKAIGLIVEAATGGVVSFATGIIALCAIMVLYETLGGLRSVAWTDALQGILLLLGCFAIFAAIEFHYGGLRSLGDQLSAARPDLWLPPSSAQKWGWLSTLLLLGIGIAMYPHAIQRIYAARSTDTLRRSLQIMVFMPLVTTLFMVIIGIVGLSQFPDLDRAGSENITLLILTDLANNIPGIEILILLFICAALAAIMSTVDSALLAISSLFTQDIYRRLRPDSSQQQLTRFGKILSWAIMAAMAYLAIQADATIWRLIVIKLELLCQIAPAIILGVNVRRLNAAAVLSGLLAGTALTLFLMLAGDPIPSKPLGIHAGIWALLLNLAIVFLVDRLRRPAE